MSARRADGRIGIWTNDRDGREAKIGAIGMRVRRWVTLHGFSVNIDPDLEHFSGIIPCGIADKGVTCMAKELGGLVDIEEVKDRLKLELADLFDVELVSGH